MDRIIPKVLDFPKSIIPRSTIIPNVTISTTQRYQLYAKVEIINTLYLPPVTIPLPVINLEKVYTIQKLFGDRGTVDLILKLTIQSFGWSEIKTPNQMGQILNDLKNPIHWLFFVQMFKLLESPILIYSTANPMMHVYNKNSNFDKLICFEYKRPIVTLRRE